MGKTYRSPTTPEQILHSQIMHRGHEMHFSPFIKYGVSNLT